MNGKATKIVKKFAQKSYSATPEEERPKTIKNYIKNLKREYRSNIQFKKFVKEMMKHYE